MNSYTVFDCETSALPLDELERVMPEFEPPGNLKDPEKIRVALAEKRQDWLDRAALSALTGKVVAIGWKTPDKTTIYTGLSELDQICEFWDQLKEPHTLVGFCTHTFDLPFLIRRSWKLGLTVPYWLRDGRYFNRLSIDLFETWQLGNRETKGTLDQVAAFFGLPGKLGSGKDFANLLQDYPDKAREYLKRDLEITEQLYLKIR